MTHDVFISYRRDGGEHLAGRVREALKARGFTVFMDVEDLKQGKFDEALLLKIEEATDVLVMMTPGCLDRCRNEQDWLRQEIRHAISCRRNIVPVIARGFEMPPTEDLPTDIADLVRYNGLTPAHEMFEASMDRLAAVFLQSKGRSSPEACATAMPVPAMVAAEARARAIAAFADRSGTPAGLIGAEIAAVVAETIYADGLRAVASGADLAALKCGIIRSVSAATNQFENMTAPLTDLEEFEYVMNVAVDGTRGVAAIVAAAIARAGVNGAILVRASLSCEDELEEVWGMEIDRGFVSPSFATDTASNTAELTDVHVLLFADSLDNPTDIAPIIDEIVTGRSALLIIAKRFGREVLAHLVGRRRNSAARVIAIEAPGFGDRQIRILEDLAILTGGRCFGSNSDIRIADAGIGDLGRAGGVVASREYTHILDACGSKSAIMERIAQIRLQMEHISSDYDREKLAERLASLANGVTVINAGGDSEVELRTRRQQIETALRVARIGGQKYHQDVLPQYCLSILRSRQAMEALDVADHHEALGVALVKQAAVTPLQRVTSVTFRDISEQVSRLSYEEIQALLEDDDGKQKADPRGIITLAMRRGASIAMAMLEQAR